ncbi:MAG: LLM class F420-dependent oxidoreductase [Acidimicrobiales bacterium]|nr:MAG: LLM class F420-dependent oxidoreductase [Acidimicrobiales bacterium]
MIFGAFVPQGWKLELAAFPDASSKWSKALEIARLAEDLGYDSLWVYDHFHNVPMPSGEVVFECWTVTAALTQATSRIRLGQMVGCAGYRNPALLAKMAATVDVMSGGRLDFGIGAGWYRNEYLAYGYEFTSPARRIRGLEEAVEIIRRLWAEQEVTYEGRVHRVSRAQCDPKPLQCPSPPVLIGGSGEQLTLRVVARLADRSNFGGDLETFKHKSRVLAAHCREVGRDFDEIVRTWTPDLFIRETEEELREADPRSQWGEPQESWLAGNLIGTPEQVAEKIDAYRRAGCGGVIPWCRDYPDTTSLELFATRVIPEFRR